MKDSATPARPFSGRALGSVPAAQVPGQPLSLQLPVLRPPAPAAAAGAGRRGAANFAGSGPGQAGAIGRAAVVPRLPQRAARAERPARASDHRAPTPFRAAT
ncbi:MAG: hypothetical protein WKG07_26035 [Hymenobacter sp.]